MTAECPGSCNTRWRMGDDTIDPVPGDPEWCRPCQARIRRQLPEIDDLLGLLAITADGHREQATGPPGGRATPSPSEAGDLIDEFETKLFDQEWEYRCAIRKFLTAPRRGYLADTASASIAWMYRHLDGVLAHPRSTDFGHFVTDWHQRLTAATKAGTGRRRGLIDCPHCKLKMLSWAEGDDHLVCGHCGRWMSMTDYHAELHDTSHRLEHATT